jgi:hypothetical protein
MIQKQVQLNGPFGSPKMGPIKHFQTEINDGGIHPEELLIEFLGTMLIGIG